MQHRLTTEITHFLSELPEEERIAAINEFRMAIHSVSPFRDEPVDCVLIVVVKANTEEYEIVDGFHRHELGKGKAALKRRLKGYLPITCLDRERHERMAATIRHNRARGRHQIHAMSEIVRELSLLGWDESKIGQELGMDADEVLRLKQINGLQELFADRRFSRAWTVK
ncbi:ParB N-terminal domain-containing protein [Salmonella enterica]